jgi:hypothetical protein
MNLQENIRRILREERKLSSFLLRRLEMLDYEVEREFNGPWGGHNICIFFKSDIEYFETIMENAIDAMYYNHFSNMDDNSGEWAHTYLDMVNYIRENHQDKIMKHYDDNCGSGLIPIKESTFFRRRIDMDLMEKEFFENLNIITDVYLKKYHHKIDFNFETFENHLINYLMDGYYNELTNGGENEYPYDKVYEFLLNYFHNKIKDRYDTFFGNKINESVDKSEDKKLKLVKDIIYNMFDNVNYIRENYQYKIMKHYDDNCGSGSIPIKESIRKVLKEELNESTYLRRRADMSTIDKKFFTNLNIVTDKYLRKHNNGQYCSFNVFRTTVISYLIDDYRDNLSDEDYDNFPFEEVYNFLLNHFYDKIKDRYDTFFGNNINESVDKSEDKKLKLVKSIIYNMFDNVSLEYDSKANEILIYHNKEEKLDISEICDTINDFTGLNVVPWFEYDKNRIGKEPDFYLDIEEYEE